jgi:hypothetical protein
VKHSSRFHEKCKIFAVIFFQFSQLVFAIIVNLEFTDVCNTMRLLRVVVKAVHARQLHSNASADVVAARTLYNLDPIDPNEDKFSKVR